MQCPFCAELDTRVVDSRLAGDGDQVRRRRECTQCKERFTTYEQTELRLPHVIKSDNRREVFREDKLLGGILRATEKRPVEKQQIELIISRIKHRLKTEGEREIKARQLGEWVMDQLRELDQVAYVRFASVYRNFEDVRAFLEEIEQLENDLPPTMKKNQLDLLNFNGDEN